MKGRWLMAGLLLVSSASVIAVKPSDTPMPKERWLLKTKAVIATYACTEKTIVRACYAITKDQCQDGIAEAVSACARSLGAEIPDNLDEQQGRIFGAKLGQCAGDTYEAFHVTEERDTPECRAIVAQNHADQAADKAATK